MSPAARLSQMTEEDLPHAIALDEASFGARRDRLLHAIFRDSPNRSACYVVDGPNRFAGFVMAKVTGQTAEVGPLVCPPEAEQKAEELAEAALTSLGGRRVYMGVSQRSLGLYRRLRAIGFQEDFRVLRMWLGGESPKAGEASYRLMESLERG